MSERPQTWGDRPADERTHGPRTGGRQDEDGRGWGKEPGQAPPPYLPEARPPGQPTVPSSSGLRLANLKEGEIVTQPRGVGGLPPPQSPAPPGLSLHSLAPSNILIQFQIFTQRPLHCLFHSLIVFSYLPIPRSAAALIPTLSQGSDSTQPAFPSIPEFPRAPAGLSKVPTSHSSLYLPILSSNFTSKRCLPHIR